MSKIFEIINFLHTKDVLTLCCYIHSVNLKEKIISVNIMYNLYSKEMYLYLVN